MSAVHGIAWGFVDDVALEDAASFQRWRREVRKELRTHRIRLLPRGNGRYEVLRKTKKSGHTTRTPIGYGDFKECCKAASDFLAKITPSNPAE